MKKILLIILVFAFSFSSFAAKVAGGDVNIHCVSGLNHEFTVTIWGHSFTAADTLQVFFGDNTALLLSNQSAFSFTNLSIPNYAQIIWKFQHNYPGAGSYSLWMMYESRVNGISNIPNSSNAIFTLTADFVIDPVIGCNSSPVLTNNNLVEQFDLTTTNFSNPGAVDPDGDSLSFLLSPCLDTAGIIPGYTYPGIIGGGTLNLNAVTGDYSWNPQVQGLYNVVFIIEQWKMFPNNQRYLVGITMREVQFDVGTLSGIHDQNSSSFSIFPNPASQGQDVSILITKSGNYTIQILTVEGKIVSANSAFYTAGQKAYLPGLSPGIYFVKLTDDLGGMHISKFIVQ